MGEFLRDGFDQFFERRWLSGQSQRLNELISASRQTGETQASQSQLTSLVGRVIEHYEYYYNVKAEWAETHILKMFKPSWTSSLENAFLWTGGWRPSMAIDLLYSESASHTEDAVAELMRGMRVGELGADLSQNQLERVDKLQRDTIKEERNVDERMASHQEILADNSMVALTHEVSETLAQAQRPTEEQEGKVDSLVVGKEEGFKEILRMADDLRIMTLKGIIGILSPIQAVHFLKAAAELHLRVHEWGKKRDSNQAPHPQPPASNGHHQSP